MKPRALFVEDDHQVAETIADILDSLGHVHDHAPDVQTARTLASEHDYHYVLLDREIPVRQGRMARVQNGDNLFEEFLKHPRIKNIPIIVTTGNDVNSPDKAVDMVKMGAFDYIAKPFSTNGKTLDGVIKNALREHVRILAGEPAPRERKFKGGPLVFYANRAELCGVKIISDRNTGQTLMLLRELANKKPDGQWVNLSAEALMKAIHADSIGTITGAVRTLRANCRKRLKQSLKLKCERYDVIVNDEQGYYLKDWITLGHEPVRPREKALPKPNCSNRACARQQKILQLLRRTDGMSATALASRMGISAKTVGRDIEVLKDDGHEIVREGPSKTGVYRLG